MKFSLASQLSAYYCLDNSVTQQPARSTRSSLCCHHQSTVNTAFLLINRHTFEINFLNYSVSLIHISMLHKLTNPCMQGLLLVFSTASSFLSLYTVTMLRMSTRLLNKLDDDDDDDARSPLSSLLLSSSITYSLFTARGSYASAVLGT